MSAATREICILSGDGGGRFRQQCGISTRSGRGREGGSREHQLRSLCEWQCQNRRSLRGDGRGNSQIGVRATSELLRQKPTRAIGPVSITHTPCISRWTCRYNEQDPAAMARLVYLHIEARPPSSVFFYQPTRASPRTLNISHCSLSRPSKINMHFPTAAIILFGVQLAVPAAASCNANNCYRAVVGESLHPRSIISLSSKL